MSFSSLHIVVFDGTTAYTIPSDELANELEVNDVEVLGKFQDFDEACAFEDEQNADITNNGRY